MRALNDFCERLQGRKPRRTNREKWYGIDPSAYPIPFRRMRFQCVMCGYVLLRAGECREASHYPWSNRGWWRAPDSFYKECRSRKDCWRRQRHGVARRKAEPYA